SLVKRTCPDEPASVRVGSARAPATPSDGPRARTITVFGDAPSRTKPLMPTLSPVSTGNRVEIARRCDKSLCTLKVAVTAEGRPAVSTHASFPKQAPDQPVKTDPASGEACSVTVVPLSNCAAHVTPQLMPEGDDVTVPEPEPALTTV